MPIFFHITLNFDEILIYFPSTVYILLSKKNTRNNYYLFRTRCICSQCTRLVRPWCTCSRCTGSSTSTPGDTPCPALEALVTTHLTALQLEHQMLIIIILYQCTGPARWTRRKTFSSFEGDPRPSSCDMMGCDDVIICVMYITIFSLPYPIDMVAPILIGAGRLNIVAG